MERSGFTLAELIIVVAILAIVAVLGMTALESSATSMATASAKEQAQGNVRDVMAAMTRELQLASKFSDDSLTPVLERLTVNSNPATGSPVEVVFQIPLDGTSRNWSRPIRFRYINEDVNANDRLDSGEDLDSDGMLTQRVIRMQDLNGDNDTLDADEQEPVGGANNITNATFQLNGDVLTITVSSEKLIGTRRTDPVRVSVSSDIYLLN